MRGALDEKLDVATDILEDDEAKASDKLGALTFLARFGLGGQERGIIVDADLLNEFFNVIELYVNDPVQLADILEKWLDILAHRVRA